MRREACYTTGEDGGHYLVDENGKPILEAKSILALLNVAAERILELEDELKVANSELLGHRFKNGW